MLDKLGLVIVFDESELCGHASLDGCIAKLHDQMQCEEHLLHPSIKEMKQSFLDGNACMILEQESHNPVAFARLIFLTRHGPNDWYEFGTVFVSENHRSHGLGTIMYQLFIGRHDGNGKMILATTTNPAALRVGQKCGFVVWPRKNLPDSVWRASCVCSVEKTGPDGSDRCCLAYSEEHVRCCGLCYFRLSPKTNQRQL